MDVSCPSLPPKILTADEPMSNEQTTGCMAAHACHFIVCSLYVLLFSIEVFFLVTTRRSVARIVLYKLSIAIVSRYFYVK